MDWKYKLLSESEPDLVIFWPVMEEEYNRADSFYERINNSLDRKKISVMLVPVQTDNWNDDLSYKKADVGRMHFEGNAGEFLNHIIQIKESLKLNSENTLFALAGYSMAGLFSLFGGYESTEFDAVVCCSGSLWFPGFIEDYIHRQFSPEYLYMSLGDREHRCRDAVLSKVLDRTKELYESIDCERKKFALENGNHFADVDGRIERGMLWLCDRIKNGRY